MNRTWSEYVEKEDIAKVVANMTEAETVTEPNIIGVLNGEPVFEVNARIWGDIDNLFTSIWLNAYGLVDRTKDNEFYQLPYGKDCVEIIKLFKNATMGIKIDGKTYIETFKEIHRQRKENIYKKEINEVEAKRASLINGKIRIESKIDEFLDGAGLQ